MHPKLKAKWIEALRKDTIPQIQGALAEDNGGPGRCCLGVLADVAGMVITRSGTAAYPKGGNLDVDGYAFLNDLGLNAVHIRTCYGMNDVYNNTFPEIADWIEKNV